MSGQSSDIALRCTGLTRRFGPVTVVDQLDLEVRSGEICALLGPSGCGKTTTLRLIAGFEPLDDGCIEINGRKVATTTATMPPEQRRVGMVFQDYALFPHLTVGQNVAFGVRRGEREAADAALALVGLQDLRDRAPAQLSGGQQQRVALARALAPRPELLLMDEPFSNLDASLRASVRQEVRRILRQTRTTAVLVTHDQEEAFSIADWVAVMLAGRIAQAGTPEDVMLRPGSHAVARFMGCEQFVPGVAAGRVVRCGLGDAELWAPAHGEVEVLARPDAIVIEADTAPEGAPGLVSGRQFLGDGYLITVKLADGTALSARCAVKSAPAVGEQVRLRLQGPVHALTRAS
ncbi:MAG: ABC transporter ATP-binding protein [Thermomicrobiales bacterium]